MIFKANKLGCTKWAEKEIMELGAIDAGPCGLWGLGRRRVVGCVEWG